MRALWIEIFPYVRIRKAVLSSRPVRALWIEILLSFLSIDKLSSRPVRALWIEIHYIVVQDCCQHQVEAREGLVD